MKITRENTIFPPELFSLSLEVELMDHVRYHTLRITRFGGIFCHNTVEALRYQAILQGERQTGRDTGLDASHKSVVGIYLRRGGG